MSWMSSADCCWHGWDEARSTRAGCQARQRGKNCLPVRPAIQYRWLNVPQFLAPAQTLFLEHLPALTRRIEQRHFQRRQLAQSHGLSIVRVLFEECLDL